VRHLPQGSEARGAVANARESSAAVVEAKARKGNAPGRKKPKRARAPHVEKSGDGRPQPAEGRNP